MSLEAVSHRPRVDLSRTSPFRLGELEIRPPTREVVAPGASSVAEPRVLQVLVALAQAQGETVSREALVQRCWEGRAIGEDAIQRAVAKARRLAELTDPPSFAIESIARVGYRLRTPGEEGSDADAPAPASDTAAPAAEPPSPRPREPWWTRRGAIAGGATAAAAGVAGGLLWTGRSAGGATPLVAVLPFDNDSPDPQLGYLADGLSEDILGALARGGGVRVTARPSSFRFRGADKARAAAALGAGYILDGSVLRSGDRLRVRATLSDVAARETLWADTFDRPMSQGLELEDEIAGQVARALRFRLTTPAPRTVAPEVFDLYLKAREAMRSQDLTTLKEARALMQAVTRRAPDFEAAWVLLAISCFRDDYIYDTPAERAAWDEVGRDAARHAVALDPRDGAPVALLAQIAPLANHWPQIERGQRRGLELSPNNPELILWRSWILVNTGRVAAALDAVERARVQDPLEYWTNNFLVQALTYLRRIPEADAAITANLRAWPGDSESLWARVWLLAVQGRDAEAADMLEAQTHRSAEASAPAGTVKPDLIAQVAAGLRAVSSGTEAERRRLGESLAAGARLGGFRGFDALLLIARLDLPDLAAEVARSMYLHRGAYVIDPAAAGQPLRGVCQPRYLFHPLVGSLRRSGRLREVFAGIGLTDFWRAWGGPDPQLGIPL